ncbi:MAG: magnesium chelatase subunit D [Pseudomonadota bacterium]|nr:magnesium chelatase subunit D [Pseudomonadota bacterium]
MANQLQGIAAWNDAITSLQLLQIDPHGFGGIWLKAPFGPVRERWLQALHNSSVHTVKLPGNIDLERLLGGIDLSTTLQTGQLRMQSGLLQQANAGVVCISMAERFPSALVAPITQAMDTQSIPSLNIKADAQPTPTKFGVIALDESLEDDAPIGKALQERLGIWLDLKDLAPSDIQAMNVDALDASDSASQAIDVQFSEEHLQHMRTLLQHIQWTHDQALAMCATAQGLGIDSLRIPSLALRVACCHAALNLRETIDDEDLEFAARRVLAPRATQWPTEHPEETSAKEKSEQAPEPQAEENSPPPTSEQESEDAPPEAPNSEPTAEDLQEMMVAAALASLPTGVLDALMTQSGRNQGNTSGRSGQFRTGSQRGRPLPPRPGRPGGHSRLHVLATLRAAAPKQKLRGAKVQGRVAIRSEDFHVHRYQQHTSSCLILALDASGSAALQRLAEAKGAVELLLQQSYARRDSVCIVAFRGAQAQLLLPMTRSLVRAKRAMTGLPGGGGTPLALALKMAYEQAAQLHRQGVTPILVMLSDGRANVTLQGVGGRAQAQADALQWSAQWRQTGHRSLWIDTSIQPDPQVQNLAHTMGGSYLPMPQVQAQRVASAMDNLRQLAA